MAEMTWQQKAQAIMALVGWQDFSLHLREDGTWYVLTGASRREGIMLSSGYDIEPTPEKAIEHYWDWLTDTKYYVVLKASSPDRRAVKWNGFMWQDVVGEK